MRDWAWERAIPILKACGLRALSTHEQRNRHVARMVVGGSGPLGPVALGQN